MTIIFYNFLPFSNSKLMPCTSVWICNIIRLLYVINVKGSVSSEITKLFVCPVRIINTWFNIAT